METKTTIRYNLIYRIPIEFALRDAKIQYTVVRRGVIEAKANKDQIREAMGGRVSLHKWNGPTLHE